LRSSLSLRRWIQRWRRLREYCRQIEKENAQLKSENAQLKERSAWLEARLRESEARNRRLSESLASAKKDSRTSSKPPSSDIVKASAKELGKKKKAASAEAPAYQKTAQRAFSFTRAASDGSAVRIKASVSLETGTAAVLKE